jgi:hypothetical protein
VTHIDVTVTVHVSKGDYLTCWPHEAGSSHLDVAPFASPWCYQLAPLIALSDGDPGQTIKAMTARF